jgi:hypothetical protein
MGTLAGCLKQLGISGTEAAEFKKLAKQYRAENFEGQAANERTVTDMIRRQRGARQQIVASIYEAASDLRPTEGAVVPAVPVGESAGLKKGTNVPELSTTVSKPESVVPEIISTGNDMADAGRNLAHTKKAIQVAEQARDLKTITPEQRAQVEADIVTLTERLKGQQVEVNEMQASFLDEHLKTLRETKPRTPLEAEEIAAEIADVEATIKGLRTGTEVGFAGTPEMARQFAEATASLGEKTVGQIVGGWFRKGADVAKVTTTKAVRVLRKPSDWKATDWLKSPSRTYQRLHPAAGKIAEGGREAMSSYRHGVETSNQYLNEILGELRKGVKGKHKGEWVAGYFKYRKEFTGAKANIFDYLDRKVSDAELAGMPPEVNLAYVKLRQWYDSYRDRIIAERRASGLETPDGWGLEDYMTHLFRGNYRVFRNVDGKWKWEEGGIGETESAAIKRAEEILAKEPDADLEIRWDNNIPADLTTRLSRGAFNHLTKRIAETTGIPFKESRQLIAESGVGINPAKTKFYRFGKKREGFKGYEDDLVPVLETYAAMTERYLAMNQFRREATEFLKQIDRKQQPQLYDEVTNYINVVSGKRVKGSAEIDNFLQSLPVLGSHFKPMALERWMQAARTFQAVRLLSRPMSAVTNRFQTFLTVYPRVGEKIYGWAEKQALTKEGRDFAREHGVHRYSPQFYSESLLSAKGFEQRTGKGLLTGFTGAEVQNHIVAFLGGERYAREVLKYSPEKSIAYGKGMVARTQFEMSMADQAPIFRHPVAAALLQFKPFQFKYLEQLADLKGREVPRALLAHIVAGGVSLPLRALPLIGMYKLYSYLKKEYGDDTADLISYGLPALLGADMSGSLGINIVPYGDTPEEKISNFITGPSGGFALDMYKGFNAVAGAPPEDRWAQLEKAGEKVFPLIKLGTAGYDLATGEYNLKDKSGTDVLDNVVTKERIIQMLGGRMIRESIAFQLNDLSREEQDLRVTAKRAFVAAAKADKWEEAFKIVEDYNNEVATHEQWVMPLYTTELKTYLVGELRDETKTRDEKLMPKYLPGLREEAQKNVAGESK